MSIRLGTASLARARIRLTAGAPSMAFADDFERGTLGTDWVAYGGGASIDTGAMSSTSAGTNRVAWHQPCETASHVVEAVMRSTDASGVFVRGTNVALAAGDNCFYSRANGTSLAITSVTSGAGAQLGATMTVPARTTADGIRLVAQGDQISVWWRAGAGGTWTLMGTRPSTDHASNRYVGARNGGIAGRWESISGGDL